MDDKAAAASAAVAVVASAAAAAVVAAAVAAATVTAAPVAAAAAVHGCQHRGVIAPESMPIFFTTYLPANPRFAGKKCVHWPVDDYFAMLEFTQVPLQ